MISLRSIGPVILILISLFLIGCDDNKKIPDKVIVQKEEPIPKYKLDQRVYTKIYPFWTLVCPSIVTITSYDVRQDGSIFYSVKIDAKKYPKCPREFYRDEKDIIGVVKK